jgi:hypothetical protein
LPLFVTLTYPNSFPTARESKRHLDMLNKRIARTFTAAGWIWKLEPQKRKAPHYHMLVWGVDLQAFRAWLPTAWYEIAGGGDELHLQWHKGELKNGNKHSVQQVESWNGVWAYAAKYIGKTFEVEGWEAAGRFWAVAKRGNIPFGEAVTIDIERGEACTILRYMRSKKKSMERAQTNTAKRKKNKNAGRANKSAVLFCDAEQWVSKLDLSQPKPGMTETLSTDEMRKTGEIVQKMADNDALNPSTGEIMPFSQTSTLYPQLDAVLKLGGVLVEVQALEPAEPIQWEPAELMVWNLEPFEWEPAELAIWEPLLGAFAWDEVKRLDAFVWPEMQKNTKKSI